MDNKNKKNDNTFMNVDDVLDYQKKMESSNFYDNLILSDEIKLNLDSIKTRRNCNVIAIGGAGTGKARFFEEPNLLQFNTNPVVIDISGEKYNKYRKILEDNGYIVKKLDIIHFIESNKYNPFKYIHEENDVFLLTGIIIDNTTSINQDAPKEEPFWEEMEKCLLSALILYMFHNYSQKECNFTTLLDLLNIKDKNGLSSLDNLFFELEKADKNNLAVKQYNNFRLGTENTRKNILSSIISRLSILSLEAVKNITNSDDLNLEKFADTKQALFVIAPPADLSFNFIINLLYSQLFEIMYKYAENKAKYGYAVYAEKTIIKVEQAASKEISNYAKDEAIKFADKLKKGACIGYISDENDFIENEIHPTKNLFYIYTKEDIDAIKTNTTSKVEPITWRGSIDEATKFTNNLNNIVVKKCERCPNHVRFIIDEMVDISRISELDKKLVTMRVYNISFFYMAQTLAQVKNIYKEKWKAIVANCDTKLFFGCHDIETAEWIGEILEKKRMPQISQALSAERRNKRKNIFINNLFQMPNDKCVVCIRGIKPYYGLKYNIEKHPNFVKNAI